MSAAEQKAVREEIKAIKERMAALKEKEARLVFKGAGSTLTVKIGEKGGLVIYGINSMRPVNLYASQAIRLGKLLNSSEFREFIEQNGESLAKKAE